MLSCSAIGLKQTRGIKNATLKAAKNRGCHGLLGRVITCCCNLQNGPLTMKHFTGKVAKKNLANVTWPAYCILPLKK